MRTCAYCGASATRAICEPAGPWVPVCDEHNDEQAMGNVPIEEMDRVNSFVPRMFGGTYEPPRPARKDGDL